MACTKIQNCFFQCSVLCIHGHSEEIPWRSHASRRPGAITAWCQWRLENGRTINAGLARALGQAERSSADGCLPPQWPVRRGSVTAPGRPDSSYWHRLHLDGDSEHWQTVSDSPGLVSRTSCKVIPDSGLQFPFSLSNQVCVVWHFELSLRPAQLGARVAAGANLKPELPRQTEWDGRGLSRCWCLPESRSPACVPGAALTRRSEARQFTSLAAAGGLLFHFQAVSDSGCQAQHLECCLSRH